MGWKVSVTGARDVCARLKKNDGDASNVIRRKKGSGRKFSAEKVEKVRAAHEANNDASPREIAKSEGLKKSTVEWVRKTVLKKKCFTKIKAQRIKGANAKKRVRRCTRWLQGMQNGYEFDPRKVWWTDEKIFRLGEVKGGNQNYRVWVDDWKKKYEIEPAVITRANGAWQGGCRVMVCLGACYYGVGAAYFVPQGTRMKAESYVSIMDDVYKVDCQEIFGAAGVDDYVFQQDGASAHTANVAQQYCVENFPSFIPKQDWPPNSPDLTVLDYFIWADLQRRVDQKKPENLVSLKVAIRQAVSELPLGTVQRAIDGFYKRCHLAIAVEGKSFTHMLKRTDLPSPPPRGPGDEGNDELLLDAAVNADLLAELNATVYEGGDGEGDAGGEGVM